MDSLLFEFDASHDFTFLDIDSPFGEPAVTLGRGGGSVVVDEMDLSILELKVSNAGVSLSCEVEHAESIIILGIEDTTARIKGLGLDWGIGFLAIPEHVLTLVTLIESDCDEVSGITEPAESLGLGSLMGIRFNRDLS